MSGSSEPSTWPCICISGFRNVWLRLSSQTLRFPSLYAEALTAKMSGRSLVAIDRLEENALNCLHVWQVALWVICRNSEFRRMLVKSVTGIGSLAEGYIIIKSHELLTPQEKAWKKYLARIHQINNVWHILFVPDCMTIGASDDIFGIDAK